MLKSRFLAIAALALGLGSAAAIAQSVNLPQVVNVGAADMFADIVNGQPTAQSGFASAAQINGVIGYANAGMLATGQTLTFGNATQEILAQSSVTIAAVTLTASANPGDGQLNCYLNSQTTTAITWNANTGQTIAGAPTAGVANTKACMLFSKATSSWLRAQ